MPLPLRKGLPLPAALILPLLLLVFCLALPDGACAASFKCRYFTLSLPKGWSLVEGPLKKKSGETAVLGRRDRKASVQLLYGPSDARQHFRQIVEGYARGLGGKPVYSQNQAHFDTVRDKQKLRFLFRHDNAGKILVIFILNGNPDDMNFLFTSMSTKHQGLVPVNPGPAPKQARR